MAVGTKTHYLDPKWRQQNGTGWENMERRESGTILKKYKLTYPNSFKSEIGVFQPQPETRLLSFTNTKVVRLKEHKVSSEQAENDQPPSTGTNREMATNNVTSKFIRTFSP
jgi:hypothetical protein